MISIHRFHLRTTRIRSIGLGSWMVGMLVVSGGMLLADMVDAADGPTFRAGAAKVKITPPLGLPIVGNWDSPPAERIHDDLMVRCLALDDGTTKLVFAICDNVGIPREVFDQARKFIDAETDVPSNSVLMSATHTHSAVSARSTREVDGVRVLDSYQTLVARRIADGVASALGRLEPAKIGWSSVDEPSEVHNRRWYVSDKSGHHEQRHQRRHQQHPISGERPTIATVSTHR